MTETLSQPTPTERIAARIAGGIFTSYNIDFATARRAGGWSNATWIAGGLALRLSTRLENQTILREARLAALLPPQVGYPVTVATGITEGYEWNLSKEITATCLGEIWDDLDWDARISAALQLWQKAAAVHTVDLAAAAPLARTRAWFNSCDPAEAAAGLASLVHQGLFTPQQGAVLSETLNRFWQVLPAARPVLNHGDLTLDNALWHAGQVVSLLDFEFALIAPAQLDLNTFLKLAFGPDEDQCPGQQRLQAALMPLAQPLLSQPNGPDLFLGYAILLELTLLLLWLAHPEGEGPLETWQPYRRLLSLAEGQGGCYAPLLPSP